MVGIKNGYSIWNLLKLTLSFLFTTQFLKINLMAKINKFINGQINKCKKYAKSTTHPTKHWTADRRADHVYIGSVGLQYWTSIQHPN